MDKKSSNFKIAICFFGHLRTYDKCAPFLKRNLINKYDCDLFMHTWSTLDHNTITWHNSTSSKGKSYKSDILKAYGEFREIEIEEQKPQDWGVVKIKKSHDSDETQMSIFGIHSMYYSMRKSNQLREEYATKNKIKYDLVLCIRPDIWLKKTLDIRNILNKLPAQDIDKSFFTFAGEVSEFIRGFESTGGTDCLFFATPEVMSDVVKNTYPISDQLRKIKTINYCPEYEFIKLILDRGWQPHVCTHQERYLDIYRKTSFKLSGFNFRKQIIRIHVRKNHIRIHLFQLFMRQLIQLQLSILDFKFSICIGTPEK
ncbi:hypothetical protein ACUNDQ_11640 [Pectobacterium brasiliense]|uniref:hypothetical protein n=1 Tax=Pectobacterium brasiliense TaxID=180957 RepID=UPI0040439F04